MPDVHIMQLHYSKCAGLVRVQQSRLSDTNSTEIKL